MIERIKAMARALPALTVMAATLSLAACGPARPPKTVSLRMVGAPQDASVTIDDIFVGRLEIVSARGVALPPGKHRISVEAPGYFPWDELVEAHEGDAPIKLDVQLVPIPD